MPWSNQSGGGGGPWGGGGGGRDGGRGPWGGGNGGGPHPPDLEDLLRKSQDRLKNVLPGGDGIGPRGIAFVVAGLLIAWALTGWYRVQPDEVGVNLVFGKFQSITPPGLNYNWPYPIGSVEKPQVTRTNSFDVGVRGDGSSRNNDESLMLTGDENIVDINFSVQWQIDPNKPQDYLFNMKDPDGTIRAVAESAMREAIGRRNIQPILTGERQAIEQQVQELMQRALDEYRAGVIVRLVQLQKVDPPQQVIDAFRDVQAARADQERLQNQARTYANQVVPEARGEAARITQAAEAYRDRTVAEANGQAAAFIKVYEEYKKAPDVTRQRIYLETMSEVLSGMDKIIVDDKQAGQGVVPFLSLNELLLRQGSQAGASQGGGQ